jgi:N-acetyl-gamma-glutamyl-phosphate reductase
MRVGILNASSYAGVELVRLLAGHPEFELVAATARSQAGQRLRDVFPSLAYSARPSLADLVLTPEIEAPVDLVFSAMPHTASAQALLPFIHDGIPAVDFAGDFRLKDPAEFEEYYGEAHPAPDLLPCAVYGLTELHREEIRRAKLVANPGCYPTGAILALAPVLAEGLVEPDFIIDAKSGVSGGGRTLRLENHFSEVNESVNAYRIGRHQHTPEIRQELAEVSRRAGGDGTITVTFVTHLVPMTRGILTTAYARLRRDASPEELRSLYREYYAGCRFVQITDQPPQTKATWGSNFCLIHPAVDRKSNRLVVVACLDNLVKGASGQALQNANLMAGLPEETGLLLAPVFP